MTHSFSVRLLVAAAAFSIIGFSASAQQTLTGASCIESGGVLVIGIDGGEFCADPTDLNSLIYAPISSAAQNIDSEEGLMDLPVVGQSSVKSSMEWSDADSQACIAGGGEVVEVTGDRVLCLTF